MRHPEAKKVAQYNRGQVLVFVMGAFAEMSEDVNRICEIIAHELARAHVSYHSNDAKRPKGLCRQRVQKTRGHTAHRGWARPLLDRARGLIIHGSTHHGDNHGVAMPTDEDHQYDLFLFNRPEREGNFAA